jgi:hypothetical protein
MAASAMISRPERNLFVIILLTALCVILCGVGHTTIASTAGAVPLILILPGWAMLVAVDPDAEYVRTASRVFWITVASIVITMAGGFILNVTGGLTHTAWVIYLSVSIVFLVLIAATRLVIRSRSRVSPGPSQASTAADVISAQGGAEAEPGRAAVSIRSGAALVVSLGLLIGAVLLSQRSVDANRPQFLELSLVPGSLSSHPIDDDARLAISNRTGAEENLILKVQAGTSTSMRVSISLTPGATWSKVVDRKSGENLTATVSTQSNPAKILRSVSLRSPLA